MITVHAARIAIPALGFGTFRMTGRECAQAVDAALRIGYRHLDTAEIYDNEAAVGAGIATSGVAREEVFLTTKAWRGRPLPGRRPPEPRRESAAAADRVRRPVARPLAEPRL